jgi:hypothetical protein
MKTFYRLEYQTRADHPWKPVYPELDDLVEIGQRLKGHREAYPRRWYRIIKIEESVLLNHDST